MDNIELKNKFIIYDLVKKYFSLCKKSLKTFKFRLFEKRSIAKEYFPLLDKDLRYKVKIEDFSMIEASDEGWAFLRRKLNYFVTSNKITYEMFRNNLYLVNGKKLKFKKAFYEYITSSKNKGTFLDIVCIDDYFIPYFKTSLDFRKDGELRNNNGVKITFKEFFNNIAKVDEESFHEYFDVKLNKFSEVCGSMKFSSNDLYLVLSCNFADWFLCSTAESWDSCLCLDSDYASCQWGGLPGIITDKNRALIYLTDGVKKNYKGIIVDRILNRSWILTAVSGKKETTKTFIHYVGEYPSSEEVLIPMVQNLIFKDKYKVLTLSECIKAKSKYFFEMLFHATKKKGLYFLSYIFCDTSMLKIGKKCKKFDKNTFAYHYINDDEHGTNYFTFLNGVKKEEDYLNFDYDQGLDGLIKYEQQLNDCIE